MTNEMTIHENALTEDSVVKCADGFYFKNHNGARYMLIYYTYANEWGDKANRIYGKTLDAVLKKYQKLTGRLYDKQDGADGMTTEELAYMVEDF